MFQDDDLLDYVDTFFLLESLLKQNGLDLSPARLIEDCQHAQRRGVKREVPFLKGEKIKGRWHYKRGDIAKYVEELVIRRRGLKLADVDLQFYEASKRLLEMMQLSVPNLTSQKIGNKTLYSGSSDGTPIYLLMDESGETGVSMSMMFKMEAGNE